VRGWLIVNARVVNEGQVIEADVRVRRGRIDQIGPGLSSRHGETIVNARGRYLLPGMIDTQVNFREPGLTRKGSIASESRAAVAGGITSYLDAPGTSPPTTTRMALADKFSRAAGRSAANYSFYLGASNDNLAEIQSLEYHEACGVKVFMGAPDGHPCIESPEQLELIFQHAPTLIAAHCEDRDIIEANLQAARAVYKGRIPPAAHAEIRSTEACLKSSSRIIDLARQHNCKLHLLHLSTREEVELLESGPIESKSVTADSSIHHLYFIDADYEHLGHRLKCNPAIKLAEDRSALRQALKHRQLDMIATDHAPHLAREKKGNYESVAAGLPLVQFALPVAWSLIAARTLTPEQLAEKIAHNPARRFGIAERGFVREGFWADLVMVDPGQRTDVDRQPILSQCAWTPFAGRKLPARVAATWVNGQLVWRDGLLTGIMPGVRLRQTPPQ
jgi:dihydroorotase